MPKVIIPTETVLALVQVGLDGDVDGLLGVQPVARIGWEPWVAMLDDLDSTDLLNAAKGLHLAAIRLQDWGAGSVTPVKVLLGELEKRGLSRLVVEFGLWARHQPGHDFGESEWVFHLLDRCPDWSSLTPNSQDLKIETHREEYFQIQAANHQKKLEALSEVQSLAHAFKAYWHGSPETRARAFAIQHRQQRVTRKSRTREVEEMAALAPGDRLARIAERQDRTLMFWPAKFARVDDSVVAGLGEEAAMSLFVAGRDVHSGEWKRLQRRLVELGVVEPAPH